LALIGCISVLPDAGPPPDVYRLGMFSPRIVALAPSRIETGVETGFEPGEAGNGWVVMVPPPMAARALNTDRIAVSMSEGRVSYAAAVRWDEPAPRVVQEAVIARYESDGRVRAAVRPEDGVKGTYELRLDLRRFEAVYADGEGAAPTVEVRLRARLILRENRHLVATSSFSASTRASENRMSAIVDAFQSALDEVTGDVVAWSLEAGDAASEVEAGDEPAS